VSGCVGLSCWLGLSHDNVSGAYNQWALPRPSPDIPGLHLMMVPLTGPDPDPHLQADVPSPSLGSGLMPNPGWFLPGSGCPRRITRNEESWGCLRPACPSLQLSCGISEITNLPAQAPTDIEVIHQRQEKSLPAFKPLGKHCGTGSV